MTAFLEMADRIQGRRRRYPPSVSAGEAIEVAGRSGEIESVLSSVPDALWTTGPDGRIGEWNVAAQRLFGKAALEVVGKPLADLFADRDGIRAALERALAGETRTGVELEAVRADGTRVALSVSLGPLVADAPRGVVGTARDHTPQKARETELTRRSITDRLTGLYNQRYFYEVLEIEKERSDRLDHALSLVLLDLDGFKEINDRQGHVEGDEVLRKVSRVLFESIRKGVDSAFRYGGDEFAILCPGLAREAARGFAERVRKKIEERELAGVRASIGVCEYTNHDRTIQLVKEADRAMYESKRAGGNRVSLARFPGGVEPPHSPWAHQDGGPPACSS